MKALTSWVLIKDTERFMRVAKAEWKVHRRRKSPFILSRVKASLARLSSTLFGYFLHGQPHFALIRPMGVYTLMIAIEA